MRLTELLDRARYLDWVLRVNWQQVKDRGADLGIQPSFGTSAPYIPALNAAFCAPVANLSD